MKKSALFFLLVFVASSCSVSQHRLREGNNSGQKTDITVQDEIKMTEELLPQLQKEYPPVKDPTLQNYINKIGNKLVASNELDGRPYKYTFTLVDIDMINAFALPAGTIYVTKPLLAMTENEAELAGVIGHEIGHVIARHAAERMDEEQKNKTKNILTTIGGGILGTAAGYGAGKLLCKKNDTKCLQKATLVGAAAGAGSVYLVQKYKFLANSREDEMEADRIGFRIATKAGFDKDKVGTFYEKLYKLEKQHNTKQDGLTKALTDAMSTHPPSSERIAQMNSMAKEMKAQPAPVTSTKEYEDAKKRVR